MADVFFLTGATGFLGTMLAAGLIRIPEASTYVLVRAADDEEAYHRLRGLWYHDRDLYESIGKKIFPVAGDFTLEDMGISGEMAELLMETVTHVIHAGAEIGFQKSYEELYKTNCVGTKNMLALAGQMKSLKRFVYISTAYVAGQKSGIVMEADKPGREFSSLYEKSKAEAEEMVRSSELAYTIIRPGMIVGDSKTGWIRNFNTIYYVLKLMLLGRLPVLPTSPESALNIVPGDYVADCVIKAALDADAEGKILHVTCPAELAPKAGELSAYVRDWAKRNLAVDLPRSVFLPGGILSEAGLLYNKKEDGREKSFITNMLTLMPYFSGRQEFDRTNMDDICGTYTLKWQDYIDRLLEFACRKNFMRQTGQTAFEQARVRRASSRYPINYYDITAEGVRRVPGPRVNERIDRIVDALWAWGIRKGDRVALTGINSVAYLALEQAIGLLGAVSVPIYYTTPADETSLLLEKSGAKWFFIGDKRMMGQIGALVTDARIVTFSVGQEIRHAKAMRWKKFLMKADGRAPAQHPDPEDLATIRYTSGTTGEPKGVTFNFGQLTWMGEVMTNLLSFEDRNRPLRYLSFLPLSHVVEGILASYAPYYLLANVDYFYLNDFGSLTEALPKVRPTVFFSVPRFYEKVWDQVSANKIGQIWLSAKDGPAKKALGVVLRRAVLRKAGIDKCRQLIVGSAPVSEALLLHFRELGIEVYNAYGQTEAPLITINLPGDSEDFIRRSSARSCPLWMRALLQG